MSNINWSPSPPENYFSQKFSAGLLAMMADVDAKAKGYAPYVTGALKNSGQFKAQGKNYVFDQFGNARVQYAAKRERGPNRDPSTVGYLAHAANDVASGSIVKYFK